MKKLKISEKFNQSIRQDGLYYNLDDLYRCTALNDNYKPWVWAQNQGCTRDISRRGWFFKKSWAKSTTLLEYANYLSPVLYRDILSALNIRDAEELIDYVGLALAARLDPEGVKAYTAKLKRSREAVKIDRELPVMLRDKHTGRYTPPRRRSVSHSRSMGPSVTHHRSEPDYLTQAMLMQAVMDDTPTRSHSSHDHSSSSWSGDSGSYDSGSSGGCD